MFLFLPSLKSLHLTEDTYVLHRTFRDNEFQRRAELLECNQPFPTATTSNNKHYKHLHYYYHHYYYHNPKSALSLVTTKKFLFEWSFISFWTWIVGLAFPFFLARREVQMVTATGTWTTQHLVALKQLGLLLATILNPTWDPRNSSKPYIFCR